MELSWARALVKPEGGCGAMERRLREAFEYCRQVTRRYSKSFYFSSGLLPPEKREAVRVLYAFARLSDNLVDEDGGLTHQDRAARLEAWQEAMYLPVEKQSHPVLMAWAEVRQRYQIPVRYSEELLEGMKMDLHLTRYQTFDDLTRYCYCAAATVGLCSMYIIGFTDRPETFQRAEDLGVALQLTNILRDVGEDWQRGRIYLPQEDMARFGYTEDDLSRSVIDERYRALLDLQVRRANTLYERGWEGIAWLDKDGRLAVAAATEVYRAILRKIVAWGYDNFHRRAYLNAWEKARLLPSVWWRVRSLDRRAVASPF
jgi:phytoene synthase